MTSAGPLEIVPLEAWDAPIAAAVGERAVAALEQGRVVFLPRLAFGLGAEEQRLLAVSAADASRKNISFDPASGRCHGTTATGEELARLGAMLDRFARLAEALVSNLAPDWAPHLERARTSFRPAEIEGRSYTPRHDDRLLHVDAFPTRPSGGRRILRVFANIAPDGAVRRWRVGEPFADFAPRFLGRRRGMLPGEARTLAWLGLTRGRRSRYDHLMLGLHDAAKLDAHWQQTSPRHEIGFPAGSAWLCFTDAVLHAALAGHMALEQTFHLPVEAMRQPELAPLRVLERLTDRRLV